MTIYFPDISGYQAGIDLAGALAVAIKATQGTWYTSGEYAAQYAEAGRHGAFRLAYHFLEAGNGSGQADYFHGRAGGTPGMLDFEEYTRNGVLYQPRVGDATAFIDRLRAAGGTCWWVYLPKWYWQRIGSPSLQPLADRGMLLWSSAYTAYTDAGTGAGWQPYGGMTPLVWQYTSSMRFGGQAAVDFNGFRGHYAGKQDDTSVDACLAEFRALSLTGRWPGQGQEEDMPLTPDEIAAIASQVWHQAYPEYVDDSGDGRTVRTCSDILFSSQAYGVRNAQVLAGLTAAVAALQAQVSALQASAGDPVDEAALAAALAPEIEAVMAGAGQVSAQQIADKVAATFAGKLGA